MVYWRLWYNYCVITMFLADNNDLKFFVDRLMTAADMLTLLREQDENQFRFAKNQMRDSMPRELVSNKFGKIQEQSAIQTTSFPTMFDSSSRKSYEIVNGNIDNMKQITNSHFSSSKTSWKAGQQVKPKQTSEPEPMKGPQSQLQHQNPILKSIKPSSQHEDEISGPDRSVRSNSSTKLYQPFSKNPFISNHMNFTDQFANSKSLQTKYPYINPSQNSRNIAAIAQSAKFSAFSQSVAFPTTVMNGTLLPPKNTFSRQTKLDVGDVMHYTLGVKKQMHKSGRVENPFMKMPRRH